MYRATNHAILLGESGGIVPPGELLPEGALSEQQIQQLVKSGLLAEEKAAPTAPKNPSGEVAGGGHSKDIAEIARSPWRLDPAGLRGKGLPALLVMIRERDEKHPLPETEEEAVAILSQDWKAE